MSTRMVIELHGANTKNRGAELMTIASVEALRSFFPDANYVVSPSFNDFKSRARLGLYSTCELRGSLRTRLKGYILRKTSTCCSEAFGIIDPDQIDVVLDLSGFAYSDQWGVGATKLMNSRLNRGIRRYAKYIMLPQAFGPFSIPGIDSEVRKLTDRASVIFARDEKSFVELERIGVGAKVRKYPDFTSCVEAKSSKSIKLPAEFVAFVPNIRMLDRTREGEQYLIFLVRAIHHIKNCGIEPVFLVHDSHEDIKVVNEVRKSVDLSVIRHNDPQVLKWVLSRAKIVIGSRFHALVSALSSCVPCIGLGWSHKYSELFKEYSCSSFLLKSCHDWENYIQRVDELLDEQKYENIVEKLTISTDLLKEKSKQMWSLVVSEMNAK